MHPVTYFDWRLSQRFITPADPILIGVPKALDQAEQVALEYTLRLYTAQCLDCGVQLLQAEDDVLLLYPPNEESHIRHKESRI